MPRRTRKTVQNSWNLFIACVGVALLAASLATPARAVTPKPLWEKHLSGMHGMAFSPDGTLLALHGDWPDTEDCMLRGTQYQTPDGTRCSPFRIELLNVRTGERVRWLSTGDVWSNTVAFSPDGQLLAIQGSGSNRFVTRAWRVSDGTLVLPGFGGSSSRYHEMLLSSDVQYAVDSVYMPRDLQDYQQIHVRKTTNDVAWSARISPAPPQTPSVFLMRDPGNLGIRTWNTVQIRRFSDGTLLRELTLAEWGAEKAALLPPEPPQLPLGQFLGASSDGEILASVANWPEDHRTFWGTQELLFWKEGQEQPLDTFQADFGCNGWPCDPPQFSPDFKYFAYTIDNPNGTPETRHYRTFVVALNPYAPANRGDLDLDGATDVRDAVKVLRYVVGLDTPATDERFRADMNANDALTVSDAVLILSQAVGLEAAR